MKVPEQFTFRRRLGHKGKGTAVLVSDRALPGAKLVLKPLAVDPGISTRSVCRAFGLLGRLQHSNLAALFDLGRLPESDEFYFLREYASGKDIVAAMKNVDFEHAAGVAIQVCAGLQFLHDHGIRHGNLKPANILVNRRRGPGSIGSVKLVDFGLRSEGDDLRSLGAILFQVFYGEPAEQTKSGRLRIGSRINRKMPGTPPEFSSLLTELLEPVKGKRPLTIAQVSKGLHAMTGSPAPAVHPAAPSQIETVISGRESELDTLRDLARQVRTQGGTLTPLVLVTGEPGTGKSRLLSEFRIECRCGGQPAMSVRASDERVSDLGVAIRLFEQVKVRLGSSGGALPQVNTLAFSRGDHLAGQAVSYLIEAARRLNPVFIIDDYDLADEASARFFATLITYLHFRYFDLGRSTY
ncbi:AAA family ATPase, partial [Acidobacteriota bacterium]